MAWQRDGIVYGQESIALIAYDAAGMSEAVGSLYEAAAALDPLMQWTPPGTAAIVPAAKAPAQLPAAPVAWQVAFPDRAVGLRGQPNGALAVLTQDGTVALLDPAGKTVWQKTVECGDELRHAASPDGNVLAVGAGHHLVAFDGRGKQLFDMPFEFDVPGAQGGKKEPSPVTAVAVSPDGKSIAAAAANGRLMLLDSQGNTKWTIGGVAAEELAKWNADVKTWEAGAADREAAQKQYKEVEAKWKEEVKQWEAGGKKGKQPPQPKQPNLPGKPNKPVPVPYLGAAFSADGSTLLAITKDQGHLIATADGKIGAKLGGIAPAFRPVRVGDNLLVTDGRERLALVSPADGKALGELRFVQKVQAPGKKPGEMLDIKDTAVSAAPLGDAIIVGTEFDGTVRALKALQGKVEEQTQWSYKVPLRLTKNVAVGDGLIAVAYWGGTLRILDATGAAKFAQVLPQDVAAMTWAG
ncbi:MAG: PQQ-binding-like beta-propeller repeat protein, partial [Planctomycetota bacterium]|nr:PQQ-binding-like beta-propeller repeat protein [Planctomycetota bacterium]